MRISIHDTKWYDNIWAALIFFIANYLPVLKTDNRREFILLGIVSFAMLFFFGIDSSPLYGDFFRYDASTYYVLGKSLLEGYRPYTDYFDNKGIAFYCIYAMGIAIHEARVGVFLFEGVALSLSSILVLGIVKQLIESKRFRAYTVFPVFFLFYFCLSEGPLAENFSMPLQLLSVYLYVRHRDEGCVYRFYAYGACMGVFFLIRPNNICITLGVILCELIECKEVKQYLMQLLKVSLGFLAASAPFVLFLYVKGSLSDMLDATILTNIKYRFDYSDRDALEPISNALRILAIGIFSTVMAVMNRNKRIAIFVIVSTVIILLVYGTGRTYRHYSMILIPLLIVGIGLLLRLPSGRMRFTATTLLILPIVAFCDDIFPYTLRNVGKFCIECFHYPAPTRIANAIQEEHSIVATIEKTIPKNERKDIYVYDCSDMLWTFQCLKTLPVNKYATVYIDGLEKYNKNLSKEIKQMIERTKPLWIMVRANRIQELLETRNYEYATKLSEEIYLYKRRN